jgi:sec-independent protein translocase protein TatA
MTTTILFISAGEIFVVFLVVLLLFGSKRIPEVMRVFGKGMREFKKVTNDIKREFNDDNEGLSDDVRNFQKSAQEMKNKILDNDTIKDIKKNLNG